MLTVKNGLSRLLDFAQLKQLFHTWGEKMSQGQGWNALFWNNHDQPRAINRFIDFQNFRVKGATMLAYSVSISAGGRLISIWGKKSG